MPMKKTTKSIVKSYAVVSGFIFLAGFLFPPMIFQANPIHDFMSGVYSGFFTLIASWIFLISGRVIRHGIDKVELKDIVEGKSRGN